MWPILSCLVIHSFRRMAVLLMLAALGGLAFQMVDPYTPASDLARGDLLPTTLAFWGSLVMAIFVTLQELPMEMHNRFHLILLSKPISRTDYLLGKVLGIFCFGGLCLLASTAVAYGAMLLVCDAPVPFLANFLKPLVYHLFFMWLFAVTAGVTGAFLSEAFCLIFTGLALGASVVVGIIPSIVEKDVAAGAGILLKAVYYIVPNMGYYQPGQYSDNSLGAFLLLVVYTAGYTGLVLPSAIRAFNLRSFQ